MILGCGATPRDGEREVEVVREFTEPDDGRGYAGRWELSNGDALSGVQLSPSPVRPGETVTLRFEATGACSGRIGLLAPRSAGRQQVYRGKPLEYPVDPRDVWTDVDWTEGSNTVELAVSRPWHAATAVVAVEASCGSFVGGARAETLASGAPRPGGRAILGMVDVVREPTTLGAPRGDVTVDGKLDEEVWTRDSYPLVSSLDGEPSPDYDTRVWVAWNDDALFVAGQIPDEDIWSEYRDQDDPLYKQEAFEVFVAADASGEQYIELQVNAHNTTFDAFFPRYRKGDEEWDSAWKTAVALDGTANERGDRDVGWTVEAAIPWDEICAKTRLDCPPQAGHGLRLNVFRLEKPDRKRQLGLALSPTLVPDFHAWDNAAVVELHP